MKAENSYEKKMVNPRGTPENDLCENSLQMGIVTSDANEIICFEMTNLSATQALFDPANIENPSNAEIQCEEEPLMADMAGVWFEFSTDADAGRLDVTLDHENLVYIGFVMYEITGDCDEEMIIRICERDEDEWGFIEFEDYGVDPGTTYRIFLYTDKEDAGEYELCINVKPPIECQEGAPYFYNHADLFCSEEDLLDYCFYMGDHFMNVSWMGCLYNTWRNPNWIVFKGGTDSILSIDLFISECQNNQGVQLELYALDKETHFDPSMQSAGLIPMGDSLISDCSLVASPQNGTLLLEVPTEPGRLHGLVIYGWASDQCKIEFLSATNITFTDSLKIPMDNTIVHGFNGDTICLGGQGIEFYLEEEVSLAAGYKWWLNGELVDSNSFPMIALDFDQEGVNEICVSAFNICTESEQKCIEVYVSPLDSTGSFLTMDTTCVGNYYNWIGPAGEVLVFFPIQTDPGDLYVETYSIDSDGCPSTHAELFLHVKGEISAWVETEDVICHGEANG
nr:hypothetical protein [Saprospiraceae bacterium]